MGNCQAAEALAVVIQHPGGKVERLYGPATAADVMRSNPGHYVALVVLRVSGPSADAKADAAVAGGGAKITKVKLLKPKDTLLLGQVYRLITAQEAAKAVQARRQDKMRRCEEVIDDRRRRQSQPGHASAGSEEQGQSTGHERKRPEKERHRSGGGRGRQWRPSLQSITESAELRTRPACDAVLRLQLGV
ncbi:uncharacterized protein LOC133895805 [Phragmites australis]|uniref:uncharacterized protein LOC133895805 n=1 Tax=Phragmites australis TaxID=29695 RepID=UPI002D78455A|nr:uncharacterized protein LOC133895805 [Phragmites australis]